MIFVVEKNHDFPLRWRHNGGKVITELHDQNQYTISNVTVDDAGIYECHQNRARGTGEHAIFQLVVRGNDCTLVYIIKDKHKF